MTEVLIEAVLSIYGKLNVAGINYQMYQMVYEENL